MSTSYPILDGRSIDRWKVAELKEELKKRKLITRGLKDDLIKRLDESIRKEREALEEEARQASDSDSDPEPVVKGEDGMEKDKYDEMTKDIQQADDNKTQKVDETAPIEEARQTSNSDLEPVIEGEDGMEKDKYDEMTKDIQQADDNKTQKVDETAPIEEARQTSNSDLEPVVKGEDGVEKAKYDEMTEDVQQPDDNKTQNVDETAPIGIIVDDHVDLGQGNVEEEESVGIAPVVMERAVTEVSVETNSTVHKVVVTEMALIEKAAEGNEIKTENEDLKPPQIDAALDVSGSNNQVYKVSPVLGSQVMSESFSADSVSINEKNELKDNLNADNVHLELDVVKPEIVQSSSSGGPASGGDLHPLDDQKPCETEGFICETDDNKSIHVGFSKKDDSADGEALEKLNHNPADDSVEEKVLEDKQINSNYNFNEVGDKIDVTEVPASEDKLPVGVVEENLIEEKKIELSDKVDVTDTSVSKDECCAGAEFPSEKVEICTDRSNTSAAPAEERTLQDENKSTDMDVSKKSDMSDGGFMEELNLDPSPDDDFMEEDALETKQIDSNNDPSEVPHESGVTEGLGAKVDSVIDSAEPVHSSVGKESSSKKKEYDVAPTEKRKFQDEEVINEPPKRQRRWNSESLKVPEPESSNMKPCTTPKDSLQARLELNVSRSDSTIGDAPKERVVPPSPKPPTNSLKIDHFLRPFTLKAVQELLAKTGNVCSFWMDNIKTHCYVMYSSLEEAIETRNAVYNLQWPSNGGRHLVADFVDPQEVKMRAEATPQSPATSVSTAPTFPVAPVPKMSPSARLQGLKQQQQQQPPALPLQAVPPLSDPPTRRERNPPPPPPPPPQPKPEKLEPPIVTLDDLFRKTRAKPQIYYLPLAEEQVAKKLGQGDKKLKQ